MSVQLQQAANVVRLSSRLAAGHCVGNCLRNSGSKKCEGKSEIS